MRSDFCDGRLCRDSRRGAEETAGGPMKKPNVIRVDFDAERFVRSPEFREFEAIQQSVFEISDAVDAAPFDKNRVREALRAALTLVDGEVGRRPG